MIRRLNVYLFVGLYLLLNSGLRADVLICCDEIDGLSFFTENYDCTCGMKHCGKVKHIDLKQKEDQQSLQIVTFQPNIKLIPFFDFYVDSFVFRTIKFESNILIHAKAPPEKFRGSAFSFLHCFRC